VDAGGRGGCGVGVESEKGRRRRGVEEECTEEEGWREET
jgi:hypothetical protein